MRTIVIGDLHGDWAGLLALLRETGAIGEDGQRLPDTRVIQLGDLIHGGVASAAPRPGVDDARCAELGLALCDIVLLGNHELPHLWPKEDFPTFAGMGRMGDTTRAALLAAQGSGRVVVAHAHERWLLTHAGARSSFTVRYPDVAAAARGLNARFTLRLETGRKLAVFDGVGPRRGGGRGELGGIFWCDWHELTALSTADQHPQIVGHTPCPAGWARHGETWCVDAGAALSGLVSAIVQDAPGGEWRPVVVASGER